ncbi:MAG TPA: hypothetical protein VJT49_32760 [Amycolatopsis sp.]|uniref:hypothetical protein n=1 Tax=Amycolatopsis sp. TaxID=37632 RepID=UPI002B49A9BE|nr:hypothetical protein [Amycolatopsis sp.]HKS49795.1 hypothetical protein [Amycolatopsis sp.]
MDQSTAALALWRLSDDELTTRLLACEARLDRDYAEVPAIVGEVNQRGLAQARGHQDCPAFPTQVLRVSDREITQRLARMNGHIPEFIPPRWLDPRQRPMRDHAHDPPTRTAA